MAAPALGVELRPLDTRNAAEIEAGIAAFASAQYGGLIVTQNAPAILHRKLIINLAGRHRLPAIYAYATAVADGGLISYGPAVLDSYRRAAGYVDRILKGAKPDDLPVQAPTKYELAINLKAAKALGIDVPPTLLARADEMTHLRHWRLQIALQTDRCRPSRGSQNSVLAVRVEVQKVHAERFPHRRLDRQIEKMIQRLFTKATR
jgi:hypothetical protein